ncbi:hypothetical protein AUF78_02230 [archaeon 13_1_20CM_2_51_12]|nr:MAG: hypothetical protein AUF78_02230 [archaeon 13_1_20CM_2_51_12]
MVPAKIASRQREIALRLFSLALLSCRYSPGPGGEARSRRDLCFHCEIILAKYPTAESVRFLNLMTKIPVSDF